MSRRLGRLQFSEQYRPSQGRDPRQVPSGFISSCDLTRLAHDFEIHSRWIGETAMVQAIREAFPDEWVVREASPEWLGQQRLDAFLPGRKIAFEYHGRQHFEPVEFFGGNEAFERRKRLDQKKRDLCDANGIRLIVFVEPEHVDAAEIRRRVAGVIE